MTIQGLRLWEVALNGHGIGNDPLPKLLITTKKDSVKIAARKAVNFMRRYARFKHTTVDRIEYSGVLDA
jgi:hypothetical protein